MTTIEAIRAEKRREQRGKEWCHCGAPLHVHETMNLRGCRLCALDVRTGVCIRGQRRWKTLAIIAPTVRQAAEFQRAHCKTLTAEWRVLTVTREVDTRGVYPDAIVVVDLWAEVQPHRTQSMAMINEWIWRQGEEHEPATWLPDSALSPLRFVPADDVPAWLERAHYYREPTREEINRSRAHRLRMQTLRDRMVSDDATTL